MSSAPEAVIESPAPGQSVYDETLFISGSLDLGDRVPPAAHHRAQQRPCPGRLGHQQHGQVPRVLEVRSQQELALDPHARIFEPYKAREIAAWHRDLLGPENYYLELQLHDNTPELEGINEELVQIGKELGIPLSINTDSHSESDFDMLPYGVAIARRA